ncbi:MAG TPA: hypothetical protein ENK18_11105 [Deltaproteobacteria bacterium]|nr:hypothetical protein [Deltaproteobacteria bacterium]
MDEVFVLALAGTSPAVVTELLWYLAEVEERRVVGIEVWTTSVGASRLRALHPELVRLTRSSGRLPEIPHAYPAPSDPPAGPPEGTLRVVVARRDEGPMDDIRTPEDADRFTQALHDRVHALVEHLGSVQLVGSLAGGRKTMSIAMQLAFTLHAGWTDRLLHVLVHPTIEGDKELHRGFVHPTPELVEALGIPETEQITVYESPLLPLRGWLGPDLASCPFQEAWGALRARLCGEPRARLIQQRLDVYRGGDRVASVELKEASAAAYRALIEQGGRAAREQIDPKAKAGAIRKRFERLKLDLQGSPARPIAHLFTPKWDKADQSWEISGSVELGDKP